MKKKLLGFSLSFIMVFVLLTPPFTNVVEAYDYSEVTVVIPQFNVEINGISIDNYHNKYPMLVYNSLTYLPLTQDYCDALGLKTSWESNNEFSIEREPYLDVPKQDLSSSNDLNAEYHARISNHRIMINGEEYKDASYPFISFQDVMYMPLTDEMGTKLEFSASWDQMEGLKIVGDTPLMSVTHIDENMVYYTIGQKLYRSRLDGSDKTLYSDISFAYIEPVIVNEWIYYINAEDQYRLYRIKTDGTELEKVIDKSTISILKFDNYLIFSTRENLPGAEFKTYRMTLDGERIIEIPNMDINLLFTFHITMKDGWIYYLDHEKETFYKINIDGNYKTELLKGEVSDLKVVDKYIYYKLDSQLYRMDVYEHTVTQLSDKPIQYYEISDNEIFYSLGSNESYHFNDIYKMNLDGTNKNKILEGDSLFGLVINGDWIYYCNLDDGGRLYKIKKDGTNRIKLNDTKHASIERVHEDWIYFYNRLQTNSRVIFARISTINDKYQLILPNGPEKYYYKDGNKFTGRYIEEENNGEKSVKEIAELSKSVVMIKSYDSNGEIVALGSGVVISDDGLIVTNLHVIDEGVYFGVVFEGAAYEVQTMNLLAVDFERDLAIIRVAKETEYIEIQDSELLNKGDKVFAIGNPLGFENSLSDGIVSGVRDFGGVEVIQITNPISPGSSGGALLNTKGELVGITTLVSINGQNVNFAVHSKYITELLNRKETKLNIDISRGCESFSYNEALATFDTLSYKKDGEYIINLYNAYEIKMDFDIFMDDKEFVSSIEDFCKSTVSKIMKKHGIYKYQCRLFAGSYMLSYNYNYGQIKDTKWTEFEKPNSQAENEKTLTISLEDAAYNLDPQLNTHISDHQVINNLFEGLMREVDGKLEYAMAESHTISQDGKTYTFKLRDAKWSDGRAVKASDFEYAWKRAIDPLSNAKFAYNMFYIEGAKEYYLGEASKDDIAIEAIDDKTLRVTLTEPTPYFLRLTTLPIYMPVRKDIVERYPTDWYFYPDTLICNGPFKLEEYYYDINITLVKNEEYHNSKDTKLDNVKFYLFNDPDVSWSAFKEGNIDIVDNVPQSQLEASIGKYEQLSVLPTITNVYMSFNTNHTPFDNVKVRKALSLGINREMLADTHEPATGYIPHGMNLSDNTSFREKAGDYDITVDKENIFDAKRLLAEAGYSNVNEMEEIVILCSYNSMEFAERIKDMWEENLGLKVVVEAINLEDFNDKYHAGEYSICLLGWKGRFGDSSSFFHRGGINLDAINDEELNKILDESNLVEGIERDKLLIEAEKLIMEKWAVLPIYYKNDFVLVNKNIKNWNKTSEGYWYFGNTEKK